MEVEERERPDIGFRFQNHKLEIQASEESVRTWSFIGVNNNYTFPNPPIVPFIPLARIWEIVNHQ